MMIIMIETFTLNNIDVILLFENTFKNYLDVCI